MINWKKEGYVVGQKVYLVQEFLFSKEKRYYDGTVTYVGSKILKVKKENDTYEKTLTFEKRWTSGGMAGYYYSVYKSEEEYEEKLSKELDRKALIGLIEHNIRKLSNEHLEEVDKLINSFNKKTK